MIGPGTKINERYLIERRIGRGGFASVYLAQDLVLERPVAVKVIIPDEVPTGDSEAETYQVGVRLLELLSEARFIARHHQANILDVYDFGQLEGEAYLVMPYASGGTLLQKLRSAGRFSLEQTGRYLDQLAAGLDYAHGLGVIHRDIKPQNIFLFSNDQAVIGDFGLAKVLDNSEAFSNTRASGTPSYMPPEQFGGRVSRASDIYSLGVVVYQMLTGQLPFNAGSQAEMMYAHINTPPPPLRQLRPDAPASLEKLLNQVLAKNPAHRPSSAGQFAQLYHQALANPDELPSLQTVPLTGEGTGGPNPTIFASAPRPDADIHQLTTHSPDAAFSTISPPSSESGPVFAAPRRARTRARRKLAPSWLQLGAIGGLIIVVVAALGLVLANPFGAKSTPTVAAIVIGNPTSTPLPPTAQVIVVTATPNLAATLTAIASATTPPASATSAAEPPATATTTPAPNETPAPTSTQSQTNQPQNNPNNQPPPQNNPPVQPQNNPPQVQQPTPVPVVPTFTPTPLPPTPTFTAAPPTPTPCGISTRRGFGQVYSSRANVAQKLGCPTEPEKQATLAYQAFTGGTMLFYNEQVYVFYGTGESGSWQRYANTFRFSDPTPTPYPSPFGCSIAPINGFNKLWANDATLRGKLGCPLAAENSSAVAASEQFVGGVMFFYPIARNGQRIYAIYNDGSYLDVANTFVG